METPSSLTFTDYSVRRS